MSIRAVEALADVWRSVGEIGAALTDEQWARSTDCPGWTVKDQVSHLSGVETLLLGLDAPPPLDPLPGYVRNPLGEANEAAIELRRPRPPAAVLDEFRALTAARLAQLRDLAPERLADPSWTPLGPGTLGDLLEIRCFDCWAHEQDIRRAVDLPGHLEGPAAEISRDRIVNGLGKAVAKQAAAPEGSVIGIEITGPAGRTVTVSVVVGRGVVTAEVGDATDSWLTMDLEAFAALGCGRWRGADALAQDRVAISGDASLGRRVVENLAITP